MYLKIEREMKTIEKYVCDVCGYVYDPAVGDPDNGVQPGTAFEAIPEDWVCPLCGVCLLYTFYNIFKTKLTFLGYKLTFLV